MDIFLSIMITAVTRFFGYRECDTCPRVYVSKILTFSHYFLFLFQSGRILAEEMITAQFLLLSEESCMIASRDTDV